MVEKMLFFAVHYGIAAVLLAVALVRRPRSRVGAVALVALTAAVSLFLFLWGQWPLVGSYHARWLPMGVAALTLAIVVLRLRRPVPSWPPGGFARAVSLTVIAMAAFVGYGDVIAWQGLRYPGPYADLEFPLKNGRFYVSSGGSAKVVNNHMRPAPNAQEFAIDINKLGALGGASRNILSGRNEDHHIFGEPVFAPCDGRVVGLATHVSDHLGASMDVAAEDGMGNFVQLACGPYRITLPHLMAGSVRVAEGDFVSVGQPLAAVGNSGFSQEPHLHLQASVDDGAGHQVGIAMRFAGESFVRNDIVER